MAWEDDVVTAGAERLAASGIGLWRPAGPAYTAGETGIVIETVPPAPDRVVVLTPYPLDESARLEDVLLGIQVRCRGRDRRDAGDLADAVRDLWHGARDLMFGPAPVALIWRASHARLGADKSGRYETTSNFYLRTARASAHLTD